ncbi:MAG: 3-deoxy-manno-octulosonate cytidylyltransferase [Proteobacteria bacterium]|nr:MAG: 3-deoxy-manno-octulosonate cytidylyltransferase [Pseudomonadota bacterium]
MTNTVLVIPARYDSTRLPGKPLLTLAGKPMIQRVYECACLAGFERIIIATDDERIREVCERFGADVCMTSRSHETGSDRLAEVVAIRQLDDEDIIVNLQGDEPLTPAANLHQVADNLASHPEAMIATLSTPVTNDAEYADPNIVKVVTDASGMALYFSRAAIPHQRDPDVHVSEYANRHIGIYAYRAKYLRDFVGMDTCQLEQLEKLEQLRAMWHGARIHVATACEIPGRGVDTLEDLAAVEQVFLMTHELQKKGNSAMSVDQITSAWLNNTKSVK